MCVCVGGFNNIPPSIFLFCILELFRDKIINYNIGNLRIFSVKITFSVGVGRHVIRRGVLCYDSKYKTSHVSNINGRYPNPPICVVSP